MALTSTSRIDMKQALHRHVAQGESTTLTR